MIFDATVDGRTFRVEVRGRDGCYTVVLDGQPSRWTRARQGATS